jgi:hypothetical protein
MMDIEPLPLQNLLGSRRSLLQESFLVGEAEASNAGERLAEE